jgi:hypothetical protein
LLKQEYGKGATDEGRGSMDASGEMKAMVKTKEGEGSLLDLLDTILLFMLFCVSWCSYFYDMDTNIGIKGFKIPKSPRARREKRGGETGHVLV